MGPKKTATEGQLINDDLFPSLRVRTLDRQGGISPRCRMLQPCASRRKTPARLLDLVFTSAPTTLWISKLGDLVEHKYMTMRWHHV